jgi:DOPA 4,5-dioxygenase
MEYLTELSSDVKLSTESKFGLKYIEPIDFYDFHIYYFNSNAKSRTEAFQLLDRLLVDFKQEGKEGSIIVKKLPNDKIIGPHPTQFWEVDVRRPEVFIRVLSWFQLNHGNLSVLIHPQTGNDFEDHTNRALWLGDKLPLLLDVFDRNATGVPSFGRRSA